MNETIVNDSLKALNQTLSLGAEENSFSQFWMWLAIFELVVIVVLLLLKLRTPETAKGRFKTESIKEEIDFNNIINSSFNSTQLYDELKKTCHPDRFPNDKEKNEIALHIFQEISKNKTNVKRLLELKEEARQTLNINFNP